MANNADNQGLGSDLLAWAADRAANWPHLFSRLINRYLELNHLTEEELRARLHCDPHTLNHLRLCGRPDPDPSAFALDVQRVADKLGLNASALASIVREVDAAEAFSRAGQHTSPFSSMPGMLQAARDREEGYARSEGASDQGSGVEAEAGGDTEPEVEEVPEDERQGEGPDKGNQSI